MSTRLITLRDDWAQVHIAPAWGGALTRYDVVQEPTAQMQSVLRPWDEKIDGASHPFALACNVLLPWSNRIGANGFHFEGDFYPLTPNVAGEPYPLHGNGFQSEWDVVRHDPHSAELRLLCNSFKPFDYEAQLLYRLDRGALTTALTVIHRGRHALPYGIGLHPWFVRAGDSVLSFDARHYWSQTPDHLPQERLLNASQGCMDFSMPRPLPDTWINTAFENWGGRATLESKATPLRVDIQASPSLSNLLVHSPNGHADFVCIEPVSHIPNAHAMRGLTDAAALTRLEPGQRLDGWVRIEVSA